MTRRAGLPRQFVPRVGNQWRARLRGIGHRLARRYAVENASSNRFFGVVVVGETRARANRNSMYFHKLTKRTGIFRDQNICVCKNIQRPQGDITCVSDRCGDKV